MSLRTRSDARSRNRPFRRTVLGASALAVAGILAACGGSSGGDATTSSGPAPTPTETSAEPIVGGTVGLSLNGVVEYTKYVAEGVAKGLDGSGYELKIVQANFDVQTELKNLEGLISQEVAGIVVQPNTIDTVLTAAKQAKEAGIPMSLALWAAPGPLDPYMVGVSALNSVEGGRLIGEWLKANAEPGPVIVVQGVVGQGFSERIDEGLDEALAGSGFEIVVREQGFFDRNTAIGVVEAALQAHPDTTVIVDYAATMGNGISSYLKQEGIENITHVTSDADAEMLTWLGTPYLAATRYYSAAETGLLATQALLAQLRGDAPTFQNDVFQTMMTKENEAEVLAEHPMSYPEFADQLDGL